MHFLHKEDYPVGLPIVLKHLQMAYGDLPKVVMAEALYYTKNEHTLNAWPDIAVVYAATPNEAPEFTDSRPVLSGFQAKDMLANVLLRLYQPERMPMLIDLIKDWRNGRSRILLLEPLLRVRNRRVGMMEL